MSSEGRCVRRLRSGPYLGEISSLCFLHIPLHISSLPFLIAGTGSQLLLYDLEKGKMLKSFHVFQGVRVHGITCRSANGKDTSSLSPLEFKIAVYGERRVKLFTLHIGMELWFQNEPAESIHLVLLQLLPNFSHWVLDVSFLRDRASSFHEESYRLAVGCSDNSVCFWDSLNPSAISEVRCPDRCLLYSMRIWGDEVEALRIASGTIYNEIIVWKVVPENHTSSQSRVKDTDNLISSVDDGLHLHIADAQAAWHYEAVHLCRLVGHEGSIFRIAWSDDGCKLMSVSDDRSARLWEVAFTCSMVFGSYLAGPVLFGHNARVWDCCLSDSLIVTAGEDCTCCLWEADGSQIKMIREHIGRGIWRCLYDPDSSLLVTAGFDSQIKINRLNASSLKSSEVHSEEVNGLTDRTNICTLRIPRLSDKLMDSKSEYVRCLHFSHEDTLYVATNNGYLYQAKISNMGDVIWTELVQVSDAVPIICMDLLSRSSSHYPSTSEDWVAVGDGKGQMTIVSIVNDFHTPKVGNMFTWSAGIERQLLGTYWCKSMGNSFIFTADPKGKLRLWRLGDHLQSFSHNSVQSCGVSLVAEFVSCYGLRIMCLDASFDDEVLVCGDLRGNLVLFPLPKDLVLSKSVISDVKISTLNYFKGAHGISSVCSIQIAQFGYPQLEINSTGADGCICCLEYDKDQQKLEFLGMKQVKELSLVQKVSHATSCNESRNGSYAVGFSSTNFLIWNLLTEAKVIQVPCGGWRRPYSYYLGDIPEIKNCFAFVKDEIIYVHRYWIAESETKICPQNLHIQFHGREMHSVCFISEDSESSLKQVYFSKFCWIATGCEDGSVRLTRYDSDSDEWLSSKLLGEHVGGSAVRSICLVSKIHQIATDVTVMPIGINRDNTALGDEENTCLLISVGAKRVLTCWKRKRRKTKLKEEAGTIILDRTESNIKSSSEESSSLLFQWLSTDMPVKYCSNPEIRKSTNEETGGAEIKKMESKSFYKNKYENDWRYLAVTAFLVKLAYSRLTVCFVVVACSDATLMLRALLLPLRIWFEVASLVPLASPVLAMQHVIIPMGLPSDDHSQSGSVYLLISGCTDGSIVFWDLTESVENFVRSTSAFQIEELTDCQKRPRTGRGSQGGRWWKASGSGIATKKPGDNITRTTDGREKNTIDVVASESPSKVTDYEKDATSCAKLLHTTSLAKGKTNISSLESCIIQPLQVLNNVHQSGVNCLHVSRVQNSSSDFGCLFYVLSGGDDQAVHCLGFNLQKVPLSQCPEIKGLSVVHPNSESESANNYIQYSQNQKCSIKFLYLDKISAAHGSAVKGIWTDGCWVFSTGLDQRVRCWLIDKHGKLTESAHLIVSVPEPEALDARSSNKNCYQIVVAGRGLQMLEFSASSDINDKH
ncbi:hypothetical protein NMG60_11035174 [Bertholletia excelsa]